MISRDKCVQRDFFFFCGGTKLLWGSQKSGGKHIEHKVAKVQSNQQPGVCRHVQTDGCQSVAPSSVSGGRGAGQVDHSGWDGKQRVMMV